MIEFDQSTRLFSFTNSSIILYHYTDKSNLASIRKYGLLSKYALSENSNSMQTGLDPELLKGLVYLSKSKDKNGFNRYSGLVTVSIPKDEFKKLTIVPDPYYLYINRRKANLIKLIIDRMKSDNDYYMYMTGQLDQVHYDHPRLKTIEDYIGRSAELSGYLLLKSNLNPKNTVVIKGDIPPEWILKTEILK